MDAASATRGTRAIRVLELRSVPRRRDPRADLRSILVTARPAELGERASDGGGRYARPVARSVGMIVSSRRRDGYSPSRTCPPARSRWSTPTRSSRPVTATSPDEALTSSVTSTTKPTAPITGRPGYSPRFYKVRKAVLQHRYDSALRLQPAATAQRRRPASRRCSCAPICPASANRCSASTIRTARSRSISLPHASFATVTASGAMGIRVGTPSTCRAAARARGCSMPPAASSACCRTARRARGLATAVLPHRHHPDAGIAPAPPPPITRDVMLVSTVPAA